MDEDFEKEGKYFGCPLSEFFNYVFFYKAITNIGVINPIGDCESWSKNATIAHDNDLDVGGNYNYASYTLSFKEGNFVMLRGDTEVHLAYYGTNSRAFLNLKAPYKVVLEKIVDTDKKPKKEEELRKFAKGESSMSLEKIENIDVLATGVDVYLNGAYAVFR